MADRYWNPASNNALWNDTGSWSATNGGSTGASIPTASDNVFLTSTNNYNCDLEDIANECLDLNFNGGSGYAGQVTGNQITIYGDLIFSASMTWGATVPTITCSSTSMDAIIQTNGCVVCQITVTCTGKYTLQNELTMIGHGGFTSGNMMTFNNANFDSNSKNIDCPIIVIYVPSPYSVNLENSYITCVSFLDNLSSPNVNWDNSTIECGNDFDSNANAVYNNVKMTGGGAPSDFENCLIKNLILTQTGDYSLLIYSSLRVENIIENPLRAGRLGFTSGGSIYDPRNIYITKIGTRVSTNNWDISAGDSDSLTALPVNTWYMGSGSTLNGVTNNFYLSGIPFKPIISVIE